MKAKYNKSDADGAREGKTDADSVREQARITFCKQVRTDLCIISLPMYGTSTTGTLVLCIDAHVCIEKIDYKTGTLFLYSKSTGAFYVGIGFFSIRSAE